MSRRNRRKTLGRPAGGGADDRGEGKEAGTSEAKSRQFLEMTGVLSETLPLAADMSIKPIFGSSLSN